MCDKHTWYIYGIIIKPRVKVHYHNNFIFLCYNCSVTQVTVNNRTSNFMEFKDLDDLARFILSNGFKVSKWPFIQR